MRESKTKPELELWGASLWHGCNPQLHIVARLLRARKWPVWWPASLAGRNTSRISSINQIRGWGARQAQTWAPALGLGGEGWCRAAAAGGMVVVGGGYLAAGDPRSCSNEPGSTSSGWMLNCMWLNQDEKSADKWRAINQPISLFSSTYTEGCICFMSTLIKVHSALYWLCISSNIHTTLKEVFVCSWEAMLNFRALNLELTLLIYGVCIYM